MNGESADGYGASETARPSAAKRAGRRRRDVVDPAHDRRVARRARRPTLRDDERRDEHPDEHQHAGPAEQGAGPAVPRRARTRHARHESRDREPETLARARGQQQEQRGDRDPSVGLIAAERGDDPRDELRADDEADRDSGPREQSRREPELVAAERRPDQRDDDGDVERVHGVRGAGRE